MFISNMYSTNASPGHIHRNEYIQVTSMSMPLATRSVGTETKHHDHGNELGHQIAMMGRRWGSSIVSSGESLRRLKIDGWVLVACFGCFPLYFPLGAFRRSKESLFWQVLYIGATGVPSHCQLPNTGSD
jgi:hypothetical protein